MFRTPNPPADTLGAPTTPTSPVSSFSTPAPVAPPTPISPATPATVDPATPSAPTSSPLPVLNGSPSHSSPVPASPVTQADSPVPFSTPKPPIPSTPEPFAKVRLHSSNFSTASTLNLTAPPSCCYSHGADEPISTSGSSKDRSDVIGKVHREEKFRLSGFSRISWSKRYAKYLSLSTGLLFCSFYRRTTYRRRFAPEGRSFHDEVTIEDSVSRKVASRKIGRKQERGADGKAKGEDRNGNEVPSKGSITSRRIRTHAQRA